MKKNLTLVIRWIDALVYEFRESLAGLNWGFSEGMK